MSTADDIRQMHAAAGAGDVEKMRAMLKAGMDAGAQDANGVTPLLCAVFQNQHRAIEVLIEAGASPKALLERYPSWPHEFIAKKSILGPESIRAISKFKGWDWDESKSDDGRTVLGVIAAEPHSARVGQAQALLECGANASTEDMAGLTPLALAAFSGSVEMLRLLASRCDINQQMQFSEEAGWTALHIAATGAISGRIARVAALLELGADPGLLDDRRRSARQCAQESGFDDVAALLDSHEALLSIRKVAAARRAP